MSAENSATMRLIRQELARFNIDARLLIESALPAFEIRVADRTWQIAAPNEVELLYGVYDCAERFFGWDFFEPGNDAFHADAVLPMPPDGVVVPAVKPRLKRCGFIQEFPFDDNAETTFDWMAKNKLNYLMVWMEYYDRLSDELKEYAGVRGIIIESGHHNFNYLIPPEKYRKDHPEFFAETAENKRRQLAGMPEVSRQLCTTNAELRSELVKNLLNYQKLHPEVKYLALNPNDGFGWCECENCSKLYDPSRRGESYCRSEKYYPANRIFNDLVSEVGEKLHAASPETILNFFAYVNYATPAPEFKLTPGIAVHLALYWRCINHAIDDKNCGINSGYFRDILAWEKAKVGGCFNIYEYFMGINFYLSAPMLHFDKMFHEFELYSKHQVDCVTTQFWREHWSVYGVNYYLMARAARNEDFATAIDRFYRMRFGKMADKVAGFYRKLQEILYRLGSCNIPHLVSFLSRTTIGELLALQDDAAEISANCDLLPGKAFAIWVEYLIRFKKFYDESRNGLNKETEVREFLEWIHAQKEYLLFAYAKFDLFFKQWFDDLAKDKNWRYFDENDWRAEDVRHPIIAPEV